MKNLSLFFILVCVFSCATKVVKDGGGAQYDEKLWGYLNPEDYYIYAQSVVLRERRNPPEVALDQLLQHPKFQIKKVALIVFETVLQPTRNGLSNAGNIYLTERGKQKITQTLYKDWVKKLKEIAPTIEFVSQKDLKQAKSFSQYGTSQEDFILKDKLELNDLDISYMAGGKKTTMVTTVNPPGMRDLSQLLVPASDLMSGPKFSEHQKHFVNDLSKELNLDAVIIAKIETAWIKGGVDKRTQEKIEEKLKVEITSSILIPFTQYEEIAKDIKPHEKFIKANISIGTYSMNLSTPILISVDPKDQNFETLKSNVLNPTIDKVEKMSHLLLLRLGNDLYNF